jgi:hypothetical protein
MIEFFNQKYVSLILNEINATEPFSQGLIIQNQEPLFCPLENI